MIPPETTVEMYLKITEEKKQDKAIRIKLKELIIC
jgi:hypothetical protein